MIAKRKPVFQVVVERWWFSLEGDSGLKENCLQKNMKTKGYKFDIGKKKNVLTSVLQCYQEAQKGFIDLYTTEQ